MNNKISKFHKRNTIIILTYLLVSILSQGALAGKITQCDRLAANPSDPKRIVSGVKFSHLRAKDAIQSCRAAIRVSPREGRFHYQLARALQKSGQYKAALASYHKAIDHSYTHAYDGAGGLFIFDLNDPRSSIPYFKVLAKRNNAHAMFMLAAAYEKIGHHNSFEYWITEGAKNGDPDALAVYRAYSKNITY